MVNNVLGMLIGAEIAEEDGGSPLAGAVEGYLAQAAIKIVTPLVVTFAIGWAVQYLARRSIDAVTREAKPR